MKNTMSAFIVLLAIFVFCCPLYGQLVARQTDTTDGLSAPLVTAQTARDHIRFSALTLGSRMRLEIISQTGDTLFDSNFRPGNLIDWPLADQGGAGLSDGIYGCIVTVEELSGRMTYRRGLFRIGEGKAVFDSPVLARSEAAYAEMEAESLSILEAGDRFPFTFVGHDGADARIESTSGGITIHAGRFFAGDPVQSPHMRLTQDGNLGIGVPEPQAKLDVAGTIRASDGFQFSDGTVLKMEGGVPVLVSDTAQTAAGTVTSSLGVGATGSQTGKTAKSKRILAAGSVIGRVNGTEGPSNTFFGLNAGNATMTGIINSFFGKWAGYGNTTGYRNSFFGDSAGYSNTTGSSNSSFGTTAGFSNTTGTWNSFFGDGAGYSNTTGSANSFFGNSAGDYNTTGSWNSFFGNYAGHSNTVGFQNTFLGSSTGESNTTENYNTFIGSVSNGAAGITNATAIGYRAKVTQSNSLILGSINGINGATADTNVGIGTTSPTSRLTVVGDIEISGGSGSFKIDGNKVLSMSGTSNTFTGVGAGASITTGTDNSFFGQNAGNKTSGSANSWEASNNSFFGSGAGQANTTGLYNSFFGYQAGSANTTARSNSFFGGESGYSNTTGYDNSFFGGGAGINNTTGSSNSFVGVRAGQYSRTGNNNSFFGGAAGTSNAGNANSFFGYGAGYNAVSFNSDTSSYNSFFGTAAGSQNATGGNNSLFGSFSEGAAGITNATAIGYRAKVTQSNSLVLGSINGVNGATADTKVGIGTTTPDRKLQIASTPGMNAELHIGGAGDEAKDVYSGMGVDLSAGPSFNFGYAGFSFGRSSGFFNVRPDASAVAPNPSLRFMTVNQQRMIITNTGNVGIGTTSPTERLHVAGNLRVTGSILYGVAEVEVHDFVFEPEYKLMPVSDLEKFLASEKHLPNVPSAAEIKEKGLSLSDFQMKLLEKIEELTLYAVQQHRVVEAKDARISALEGKNSSLEAKVAIIPALEAKVAGIASLEARLAVMEQMLARQQDPQRR